MTNRTRTLHAYAKLNIAMDVVGKRADGYHLLDMLNIRISLHDKLQFAPALQPVTTYAGMEHPKNDIVLRVMESYAKAAKQQAFAHVHIEKHIPAEAGLGGGSADAATVLNALQAHYRLLSGGQLQEVALSTGADVPYCMTKSPARVQGIGERIKPLPGLKTPLWFVIVKPEQGISSGALFSSLQTQLTHPDIEAAETAFLTGSAQVLAPHLNSALQTPAIAVCGEIKALLEQLKRQNALAAVMSGAGSAVFGLFADEAGALHAAKAFQNAFFCVVCHSI